MKRIGQMVMAILSFFMGGNCLIAQQMEHPIFGTKFYPSNCYSLIKPFSDAAAFETDVLKNEWPNDKIPIYILKQKDSIYKAFDIFLDDASGSEIRLWVNNAPNLEGMEEIILVENYFSSCGDLITSFYLIKTTNGRLIPLPHLESINEGNDFQYWQYRFPNEKFGRPNKIILGYLNLTQANDLISFQKEKVFLWDGEKLIPQ
jgi:hypothetical protein